MSKLEPDTFDVSDKLRPIERVVLTRLIKPSPFIVSNGRLSRINKFT